MSAEGWYDNLTRTSTAHHPCCVVAGLKNKLVSIASGPRSASTLERTLSISGASFFWTASRIFSMTGLFGRLVEGWAGKEACQVSWLTLDFRMTKEGE